MSASLRPSDHLLRNVTLAGVALGVAFPVTAWLVDLLVLHPAPLTPASWWLIHTHTPLHWLIDTAPLVLGLFAYQLGRRRLAEARLAASGARIHSALDALEAGLLVYDAAGRVTTHNPSAERILGLPADQILGHDPLAQVACEDGGPLPEADGPVRQAQRTGQAVRDVVVGVRQPAGGLAWVAVTAQPVTPPAEGQSAAIVVSLLDVTERRLLDTALKQERDFALQVMTTMGQGLVVTDDQERLEYANPAFAAMLGQPAETLLGCTSAEIVWEADQPALAAENVRRRAGEASAYPLRLKRADGTPLSVSVSAVPRYQAGAVAGSISVITDLSEQARAEAALAESEQRFRALATLAPVGIFQGALNGDCVFVNDRWQAMAGLTFEQALGRGWVAAIHPEDRARVMAEWYAAVAAVRAFNTEYRFQGPHGHVTWVHGSAAALRDEAGVVTGFIATNIDITESKEAEEALTGANERLIQGLAEVEQRNQEIALLNTMSGLLQSCMTGDEAAAVIRDMAPRLFPGRAGLVALTSNSRNLVEAEVVWGDLAGASQVFTPPECWALRRGRLHGADAGLRAGPDCRHVGAAAAYLCAPMMAQGEAVGVLTLLDAAAGAAFTEGERQLAQTVADNIALALANLKLRETLRNQSVRDSLTGLFNRRYMEETLERELRRAARGQTPVGVIVLDIDHFKRFNDTFGHGAGDVLLRELGVLLRRQIRGEDVACRYGGEEFVLILPGAPAEVVQHRAEQIGYEATQLQVSYSGQPLGQITVSLGVAIFPLHAATPALLLGAADAALYRAKRQGRNQTIVADIPPAEGEAQLAD
ncbi:MAG: diguanylate cyclase [Anaerolineales bacterium]|nr:diguanylate cyclase [Anaerolineales bacterium]